jgi:hypothetical protein
MRWLRAGNASSSFPLAPPRESCLDDSPRPRRGGAVRRAVRGAPYTEGQVGRHGGSEAS